MSLVLYRFASVRMYLDHAVATTGEEFVEHSLQFALVPGLVLVAQVLALGAGILVQEAEE